MDFDNLPQDDKIVCLCSIFPEMDPSLLNDLLEMYKTGDELFPVILELNETEQKSKIPQCEPAIIYPFTQPSAPPIHDYKDDNITYLPKIDSFGRSQGVTRVKENKFSDRITEVTSKVKNFISNKFSGSSKGNYSQLRTQEWVDWDEELDDPENQCILYDSKEQKENLRKRR